MNWKAFSKEYTVSLFPVLHLAHALADGVSEFSGRKLSYFGECFEGHALTYCVVASDWNAAHDAMAARLEADLGVLDSVIQAIQTRGDRLLEFSGRVKSTDWSNESNQALVQAYHEYSRLNIEMYSAGAVMPLLDYQETTWVSDKLIKLIEQRLGEDKKQLAGQYMSILTMPLEPTYEKQSENELKTLADSIKHADPTATTFIKSHNAKEIAEGLSGCSKVAGDSLESHWRKWCWTQYVYEGPAMSKEFFAEELKLAIESGQHVDDNASDLADKQSAIVRELGLDADAMRLVDSARKLTYWKPMRRLIQTKSYYEIEGLLTEIGSRMNLPIPLVRWLVPQEFKSGLLEGISYASQAQARSRNCAYVFEDGGFKVLSGDEAKAFFTRVQKDEGGADIKELKGTCASPGFVKGIARIINTPEDVPKLSKGEILVSVCTNPNLMVAIKKAAAIVTDEGGLTCHAAIVSREFGVPCVVGTRKATKAIRDGDLIEVDASKGIVTILAKA